MAWLSLYVLVPHNAGMEDSRLHVTRLSDGWHKGWRCAAVIVWVGVAWHERGGIFGFMYLLADFWA